MKHIPKLSDGHFATGVGSHDLHRQRHAAGGHGNVDIDFGSDIDQTFVNFGAGAIMPGGGIGTSPIA